MGFLRDLTVSKISFVTKAANKRRFVLLKSDDSNIDNKEDSMPMRKEVQAKLVELLKSQDTPEKVLELLKADTTLKVTEAELPNIIECMDIIKQTAVPPKEEAKEETAKAEDKPAVKKDAKVEKSDNEKLLDRLKKAEEQLDKVTKENQRNGVVAWLVKECKFMLEDVEKAADTVMELYAVSAPAAEKFKVTLQKSSKAIESSKLFEENGRTSIEGIMKSDSDGGFDLIRKVSGALDTLKKSDKPLDSKNLVHVIKGFGNEYESYRRAHILRAKTQAI